MTTAQRIAYEDGLALGRETAPRFTHVDLRFMRDAQLALLINALFETAGVVIGHDPLDPKAFNPDFFAGFAHGMRNHEVAA